MNMHHNSYRFERKSGPGVARIECGLIELKFDATDEKAMTFEGYGAVSHSSGVASGPSKQVPVGP